MECPNCYTEKTTESNFSRGTKKSYLSMNIVVSYQGYVYYQCSRCLLTRKQESGYSTGIIENVTKEELRNASENSNKVSLIAGIAAVTLVGAGLLFGGKSK